MNVRVKNRLIIREPTKEIIRYCKDYLIIDNPDYYKLERMGKYTGGTSQKIWLYESMGDELWLPFGCLNDVWRLHPVQDDYSVEIEPIKPVRYESYINLYPYQEKAVNEAIRAKNGVLVMPCGSGKTQCGLEIISRIGGRALWLTHTQDLLNQSKSRAEAVLGQGGYGTITAGKVFKGSHITFALVQTLAKRIDLLDFTNQFDVIIVDEAQHCAGTPTRVTQFYKVVSRLSARYKIGLTATPKRADRLEAAMFALLGPKIHEVTRDEVAYTTCPIRVKTIETGWMPDYDEILMGDGTIDYSKVIDNMIHSDDRYSIVLGDVVMLQGPTMILANRVEYLQRLTDDLTGCGRQCRCLSGQGQSKKAKAERKAALEQLNNGDLEFILATYQLAKEGLDVPNLRYVVFATPEKDETTVVQSVGRVGRKAEGKPYGTVIDFVDDFGMYRQWQRKRENYYWKLDAEVVE